MINCLVVSGEALGEYENLHRKFAIEQECRDKAEEYAKMVKLVCTQSDDTYQTVPLSSTRFRSTSIATTTSSSILCPGSLLYALLWRKRPW